MNEHPRRDVDDRLADWVDGRMSDKERERFVAELRVSAQLRQDLEQYERTVGVVRAALRAPAPSAGIADRVMAAIAADAAAPAGARARGSARARVWWSVAAAAALLATAVVIARWRPAEPATSDTAAVGARQPVDGYAGKPGAGGARQERAQDDGSDERSDLAAGRKADLEEQVAIVAPDPTTETPLQAGKLGADKLRALDLQAGGERRAGEPSPQPKVEAAEGIREGVREENVEQPVPPKTPGEPQTAPPARARAAPARTALPALPAPAEVPPPGADAKQQFQFGSRVGGKPVGGSQAPSGPSGPTSGGPGTNTSSRTSSAAPGAAPEDGKKALDDLAALRDAERSAAPVPLMIVEGVVVASPPAEAKSAEATDEPKGDSKGDAKDPRPRRGAPPPASGGGGGNEGAKAKNGEAAKEDDRYAGSFTRLDGAALIARVDAFLADAAAPSTAAAAIVWTTERGELRVSPLIEETMAKSAPETPADGVPTGGVAADKVRAEKAAAAVVERTWLVEGADADVQVVLARLSRFTQAHRLSLRSGETTAPAQKSGDAAAALAPQASSRRAQPSDSKRVVLRFRLRPR